MKVENYFLRYAFPCAFIINEMNEVDKETVEMLEKAAIEQKVLDRELLEKIFFRAFEKIQVLADEMGKDKWDYDVMKTYFRERHNQDIDNGVGYYKTAPKAIKELSKVFEAEIVDKRDGFFIVQYNGKTRTVSDLFVSNAKKGDKVTIHYGFAVEAL
ncbi:hypothetical protein HQ529_01405 [Candidatus Woesearchaeota archaeon]|nr:hypothetical protein [Candidatus Woesearchaeota archaeon]